MRACGQSRPSAATPPAAAPEMRQPVRDAFTGEVVAVLVQMALAHV
jgi:hypothetical protein